MLAVTDPTGVQQGPGVDPSSTTGVDSTLASTQHETPGLELPAGSSKLCGHMLVAIVDSCGPVGSVAE